jgi:hypothetical protein
MSHSVPLVRANALPLLTLSVLTIGLIALLPLPAHAAEERLFGNVVSRGVVQDVSTVAGDIEVKGLVDNDVDSGIGNVNITTDGEVRGDVDANFGDVKILGPVGGDVDADFGDVYINAPVSGDVDVGHGDVKLGPKAEISGDLECESCAITGHREAANTITAKGMPGDFDESNGPGIIGFVGWLLATGAFAACAVLASVVAPRALGAAARRVEESPGRAFVYGLVSVPAFFVLCVVLAITVVGIPLAAALAVAYPVLLFFGALVAAFFLGTKVLMFTGRYRVGNAAAAAVGATVLAATTFIPVLGDLLLYALCLLGTGAVLLSLLSRRPPRATHPSYEAYVRDRAGG